MGLKHDTKELLMESYGSFLLINKPYLELENFGGSGKLVLTIPF